MDKTPDWYIRRQERRRKAGKVIAPLVGKLTLRPLPTTLAWNVPGPTSRWSLGRHTGEDHAGAGLVTSVSWGHVTRIGSAPESFGNYVVIRTGDGELDVWYCHLLSTRVSLFDRVRPGQTLGHSGSTGNATGVHLHLEVRPARGAFGTDVSPMRAKRLGVK
jgi:murein DD-endopeptidase MepM/ murein hydrolase activator NlpD